MAFDEIKKNFGFGCMRFPMLDSENVDVEQVQKMVDTFMANGFNYFDTACVYIHGESEKVLKECLTSKYPRESYVFTDKLSPNTINCEDDVKPQIYRQLETCGLEYFDILLMHCQNSELFEKYKSCRAYEQAFELKKEGKVRHVGFSFHDSAEVLDKILTEYPEVEVVQLQFNYADYESDRIQSRLCYEVCRKHGKPIIVMEPVKGGMLVNLPEKAKEIINTLGDGSPASYAIRFAASFEGVIMVLSGMSNTEQMNDNVSFMKDFVPLTEAEIETALKAGAVVENNNPVNCTACRYCVDGCPMGIKIPDVFAAYRQKRRGNTEEADRLYVEATDKCGLPSDCVGCGQCEDACPQHLEIRSILSRAAEFFE